MPLYETITKKTLNKEGGKGCECLIHILGTYCLISEGCVGGGGEGEVRGHEWGGGPWGGS